MKLANASHHEFHIKWRSEKDALYIHSSIYCCLSLTCFVQIRLSIVNNVVRKQSWPWGCPADKDTDPSMSTFSMRRSRSLMQSVKALIRFKDWSQPLLTDQFFQKWHLLNCNLWYLSYFCSKHRLPECFWPSLIKIYSSVYEKKTFDDFCDISH